MDRTSDLQLKEVFSKIEGAELNATVSSESSMRRILTMLGSNKSVVDLVRALQHDMGGVQVVLSRMARLATTSADYRFRNRHDTALAAYLYAVMVSSPQFLSVACRIVLTAQNTWLSNQLVERITAAWTHSSTSTTQNFQTAFQDILQKDFPAKTSPQWSVVNPLPLPEGPSWHGPVPDLFGTLNIQTLPATYGTFPEGTTPLSQGTLQQGDIVNDLMQLSPISTETIFPVGVMKGEESPEKYMFPWTRTVFARTSGVSRTTESPLDRNLK